jgi:predicted ATPase
MGEFHEAQGHADAAIALESRAGRSERRLTVLDPVVASLAESSRNLWITGNLTRSVEHCERAVALGRELRHPDSLAFAWLFHGWLHGYRRDWAACLRSAEEGIVVANDSGSVQTLAWNRCVRGWAVAHARRVEDGLDELSAAIEAARTIMGDVAMPQFSAMMSEVLLLRDDVITAEEWIDRGLELSKRGSDHYFDAELHRLAATCALARGRREAAVERLQHALAVARSQGAATFELRAALALATPEPAEGARAVRSALAGHPDQQPWLDIERAREVLASVDPAP